MPPELAAPTSPVVAASTTDPPAPFGRVAVLGCGLIGGSFAAASQTVSGVLEVTVHDRDPEALVRAQELGVGTRWVADAAQAVVGADLVLLAVPVEHLVEVARAIAPSLSRTAIVTDVGSVKAGVVRDLHVEAGLDGRYIGGHPMAGSERSGVDATDPTLFQAATWLLTPTAGTDEDGFNRLAGHLRRLGARVLAVPPDLHDELVAIASHLPQALASVLMAVAADAAESTGAGLLAVAAGGFRDVTRVAASDPDLWVGILRQNRPAFLRALDHFTEGLADLRDRVDDEDWDAVRDRLAVARSARRTLPRKAVAGVLIDLVVPIPDRPGALAEVTTALGTGGVNIEDLSMRHAGEGMRRGAMVIAVDGEAAAERAQALLADLDIPSHREPR